MRNDWFTTVRYVCSVAILNGVYIWNNVLIYSVRSFIMSVLQFLSRCERLDCLMDYNHYDGLPEYRIVLSIFITYCNIVKTVLHCEIITM